MTFETIEVPLYADDFMDLSDEYMDRIQGACTWNNEKEIFEFSFAINADEAQL